MNNIYLSAEILLVSVSDIDTDNYRKTSKKVISILLEKRDKEPFKDMWNIPGLLLNDLNDTLFQCANRVLRDKVGIKDNIYLEQLYTFDRLNRDPKRRVITTSYIALIDKNKLKTQPKNTCWFNVEKYSNTSKWIKLTLSNGEETLNINIEIQDKTSDLKSTHAEDVFNRFIDRQHIHYLPVISAQYLRIVSFRIRESAPVF